MRFTTFARSLMALMLLTAGAAAAEEPAKDGLSLVMFEQPGCGFCERWREEIGPIYPKTDEGRRAPLRHVDLFDPRPEDLTEIRRIRYTPTFVLVRDGEELGRIEGYNSEDFFWGLLAQAMKGID